MDINNVNEKVTENLKNEKPKALETALGICSSIVVYSVLKTSYKAFNLLRSKRPNIIDSIGSEILMITLSSKVAAPVTKSVMEARLYLKECGNEFMKGFNEDERDKDWHR